MAPRTLMTGLLIGGRLRRLDVGSPTPEPGMNAGEFWREMSGNGKIRRTGPLSTPTSANGHGCVRHSG